MIFGVLIFIHRTGREQLHFPKWPKSLRWTSTFLLYVICIVPFLLILISGFLGVILAAVEGWSAIEGFEYVVSNAAALSTPLTDVGPESIGGDLLDLYISAIALLLVTTTMGIASSLSIVGEAANSMPPTIFGLIRYMILYIPVSTFAVSAGTGAAMAAIENWSFADGFLFMASSLCGLANPLTDVVPDTAFGAFFEVVCVAAEVCLGGAILGLLGAHPLMPRVVGFLEGETMEEVLDAKQHNLTKQFESVRSDNASEENKNWTSMDKEELINELQKLTARKKELEQIVREGLGSTDATV